MAQQDPHEIADALAALASGHDPEAEEADESRAETHARAAMRSSRPALPSDILPPIAHTQPDPDDQVLAPPPDPSMLGRIYHRPHQPHKGFGLEARRTMIPILLTCGVLLLASGLLKFIMGPDSPFAPLPVGMIVALWVLGLALLGSAVVLMLGVRAELARSDVTPQHR
jgi:hypothetical protein